MNEYKYTYKDTEIRYPGGRCYCKNPGLRDKVVSWDFKGYYSSLMRTFNIGPDSLLLLRDLKELPAKIRPHIRLVESPYTIINKKVLGQFIERLEEEGYGFKRSEELVKGFNRKIEIPKLKFRLRRDEVDEFYYETQNIIDDIWKSYDGRLTIKRDSFHGFFFRFRKSRVNAEGFITVSVEMPYPCYFRQDFDSIVRIANETAAKERKIWKNLKNQWEYDGGSKDSIEWKHYESEQLAYKLFGNIMYGQAGNIYSRIYAVACAMSITLAGQMVTEWTRAWFEKNGMSVVYMDTDSNYVYDPRYTPEREQRFIKHFEANYHKSLWKFCEKKFGVRVKDNCIILEREKRWFRMMFLSKKRYVGIVEESDGKPCWKLVSRGVELRRTGTIQFAKDFQEAYYDMIFQKEIPNAQVFWDYIVKKREEFYALDLKTKEGVEQITKRQKVTMKIEDYKAKTAQVNLMVRCKEDGEEIEIGDMLEYVLLKVEEKQKKNYAETVDRYLRDTSMVIHVDQYWDKEIFNPIFEQLQRLFPDYNWGDFHGENKRMADKKYKACVNRFVKKKLQDQKDTITNILKYKRFSKSQKLELLKMAQEKYREVQDRDLQDSILNGIEYYENNMFLKEGEEEDE